MSERRATGHLDLVNPAAAELQLLPLAADVAERVVGGWLTVTVDTLPVPGLGAIVDWSRPDHAVVIIDPEQCAELGDTADGGFAHELAHLLDPRFAYASHDDKEAWANALGPLLLARQPATVGEALRIEGVECATCHVPDAYGRRPVGSCGPQCLRTAARVVRRQLGLSATEPRPRRRRLPGPPPHGTVPRRKNHCCDCEECVEAGRRYDRRQSRAESARLAQAIEARAVPERFPFEPLEDRIGESTHRLADLLRVSGATVNRLRSRGLTLDQADRYATRAGLLAVEVWPDMALCTPAEAAGELEVSVSTILRRIGDGTMTAVRTGAGVRVPWVEVERIRRAGVPLTAWLRRQHAARPTA